MPGSHNNTVGCVSPLTATRQHVSSVTGATGSPRKPQLYCRHHVVKGSLIALFVLVVGQEIQTMRDSESYGQSERWTLHGDGPVQRGQDLVRVRRYSGRKGDCLNFKIVWNILKMWSQKDISWMLLLLSFNVAGWGATIWKKQDLQVRSINSLSSVILQGSFSGSQGFGSQHTTAQFSFPFLQHFTYFL